MNMLWFGGDISQAVDGPRIQEEFVPKIACTQTLFYFSFSSFRKDRRAKRARENERGATKNKTKQTNFIENWKITNYVTFPPANSL